MGILEAEQIVSGYTDINIVKGVDLTLEENEIVTLIGPNGAGKSTVLKTLFGLVDLREGQVTFKGEDISGFEPNEITQEGICFVPQRDSIFPNLSVADNLKMGAYTKSSNDDFEKVFDQFPALEEKLSTKAKNLSGGQQRMVSIGMALMLDPDVLLVDEPSAGLAPDLVDEMFRQLIEVNESAVSILLVEQNAQKALQISDRGYVLDNGEVRFVDDADVLLENQDVRRMYLGK
jgi:branched-chain amino acid transport system ATP-binding protein